MAIEGVANGACDNICYHCLKSFKTTMYKCVKCYTAIYCSGECQMNNWQRDHKPFCDLIKNNEKFSEEDELLKMTIKANHETNRRMKLLLAQFPDMYDPETEKGMHCIADWVL